MLRMVSSFGLMPNCSRANSVWKWVVEAKGTPSFLPLRSCGATMPEPSRTTSASAEAMSSKIQTTSTSTPRLIAAAAGLDPDNAICTSPEAMALITLAPESNLRQSIS